jgi:hypothetical protein
MAYLIHAATCAEAWLKASEYLLTQEKQIFYNLILDIDAPLLLTDADDAIVKELDGFLREHDKYPISTVAGTIFPAGLYTQHGVDGVYNVYPRDVYPIVKERWGTYAMRLLRRKDSSGADFNPLERVVEKLKRQMAATRMRAVYELTTIDMMTDLPAYDPAVDSNATRGQHPCLSHLSFKLADARRLNLTALYRYHYYVQKTLGNLIGLAQLQAFVAKEAGLEIGSLVCHSTFAILDVEQEKKEHRWSMTDNRALLHRCREVVHRIGS